MLLIKFLFDKYCYGLPDSTTFEQWKKMNAEENRHKKQNKY